MEKNDSCSDSPSLERKFEILDDLGDGLTSTVHLARNNLTNELVAVKVALKGYANYLRTEFVLSSKFKHPNIVRALDFIEAESNEGEAPEVDGKECLVMELLSGGEMFDLILEHGRLEESVARFYFL